MSDAAVLCPPNASPLARALDALEAERQALLVAAVRGLWDPWACPLAVLPWLAWAFSVDVWDSAWPEAKKRAVVAASLAVHRRKGTRGALERALAAVGHPTQVVEWWEQAQPADPYTFRVRVGVDEGASLADLRNVAAQIQAAKNLRSWLTGLELTLSPSAAVYVACAGRARVRVRIPAAA